MAVLAHDIVGHGTHPLLVLHGFLGSGRNLATLARRLITHDDLLRIVLPDQLGHGDSPALPPDADLYTMADAVLRLMTDLHITKASIVGHSLGGRVALAAKSRAPERIERIVLLDIAPGPTAHFPAGGIAEQLAALPDEGPDRATFEKPLVEAGLDRGIVSWLMMNLVRTDDGRFTWRIDRDALVEAHQRSGHLDLWPVVEGGADVRVIRGRRSPYVTDEDVDRFALHGVDVKSIDAGHFLHAERPQETFDAVVDALA